ncbi:MAG: MBL fold metallo-hydrolase [Actinomycetota bacterium]|nr:MBL fold metallo-hydrolase [Actinomycetota bacterium]
MSPTPIEALRGVPLVDRQVALSWLGQAGFVLRTPGGTTALIDPFLSPWNGRLYESALPASEASGVDLVLITHEHVDHFDAASAPAIAAASPEAVFVVPTPIADMVTEAGIAPDRVLGVQPGGDEEIAGFRVRPVPARHGVTMRDAYGFGEELSGGLIRFLGFVIDAGGVRIYHAGDTIHFPGMEGMLRDLEIDVGLLPINGRDPEREARDIVGNLSEREAGWLARVADFDLLIPMHYDLFARNRGYPARLVDSVERDHPGVPVFVPPREHPFVCSSRRLR